MYPDDVIFVTCLFQGDGLRPIHLDGNRPPAPPTRGLPAAPGRQPYSPPAAGQARTLPRASSPEQAHIGNRALGDINGAHILEPKRGGHRLDLQMQDWSEWRQTLAQAIDVGRSMGMSDREIADKAEVIGDFLANNVDPQNPEQRILKELWEAADENQQQ